MLSCCIHFWSDNLYFSALFLVTTALQGTVLSFLCLSERSFQITPERGIMIYGARIQSISLKLYAFIPEWRYFLSLLFLIDGCCNDMVHHTLRAPLQHFSMFWPKRPKLEGIVQHLGRYGLEQLSFPHLSKAADRLSLGTHLSSWSSQRVLNCGYPCREFSQGLLSDCFWRGSHRINSKGEISSSFSFV